MTEEWQTVVELAVYLRKAERLLDAKERRSVVTELAQNPERGDLIPGGSGIRKVRFAAKGKGKSGGVRVIYYFHSPAIPLFLLSIYGKGEKTNLTRAEVNSLAKAVDVLADEYGE
jgi:hypothetical protein